MFPTENINLNGNVLSDVKEKEKKKMRIKEEMESCCRNFLRSTQTCSI